MASPTLSRHTLGLYSLLRIHPLFPSVSLHRGEHLEKIQSLETGDTETILSECAEALGDRARFSRAAELNSTVYLHTAPTDSIAYMQRRRREKFASPTKQPPPMRRHEPHFPAAAPGKLLPRG